MKRFQLFFILLSFLVIMVFGFLPGCQSPGSPGPDSSNASEVKTDGETTPPQAEQKNNHQDDTSSALFGDENKVPQSGNSLEKPEDKESVHMADAKDKPTNRKHLEELRLCQLNLMNIGTALEMWATDHNGHYPESLSRLTPDYLRLMPTCPSARIDTYSQSYNVAKNPDLYTFYCQGHHHGNANLPKNQPYYSGLTGLTPERVSLPEADHNSQAPLLTDDKTPAPQSTYDDSRSPLEQCQFNIKNIATALEMWASDNRGRYPRSISEVAPHYLKVIPTCPVAGRDTYQNTYRVSTSPDIYTFFCQGHHHKNEGLPENFPFYSSFSGMLLDKNH